MTSQPTPDGPEPGVLREEMINIVVGDGEGRISRHAAGKIVDEILRKQMMFYSQFAQPELTASVQDQLAAVTEVAGLMAAVIKQGARHCGVMTPDQLRDWQTTAARARAAISKLVGLFT
jgi:hypothetical protein